MWTSILIFFWGYCVLDWQKPEPIRSGYVFSIKSIHWVTKFEEGEYGCMKFWVCGMLRREEM